MPPRSSELDAADDDDGRDPPPRRQQQQQQQQNQHQHHQHHQHHQQNQHQQHQHQHQPRRRQQQHYLLERIDNRYRCLLDEMDVQHSRAMQELKDGYNAILRLQESLIFQQAEHISRLERQLDASRPASPTVPAHRLSVSGSGGHSLDLAQLDAILNAQGPPPPPPPKNKARPKSIRCTSFSGATAPAERAGAAEDRLERAAREQLRTWKRQIGTGSVTATTASDSFDEADEEAEYETVRAGSPPRCASRARTASLSGPRGGRAPFKPGSSTGSLTTHTAPLPLPPPPPAKLVKPKPERGQSRDSDVEEEMLKMKMKKPKKKPKKTGLASPVGLWRRLWQNGLWK